MIGTSKLLAVIACCFVLLVATTVHAGILVGHPLAYNDGNGPIGGAWSGTSPFANDGLTGTVDWAVFTAANFNLLPGLAGYVAPAGEFVYAHQVFTTGPVIGVSGMDIDLPGAPAGNGGSFTATGISGVPAVFAFADSDLATYVLAAETSPLTPSDGLAYSSPARPQLTGAPFVVDGGLSATGALPIAVPVPEPASLLLGCLSSVFLFWLRRERRG